MMENKQHTFWGEIFYDLANMPWPWVGFHDQGSPKAILPAGQIGTICEFETGGAVEEVATFIALSPSRLAKAGVDLVEKVRKEKAGNVSKYHDSDCYMKTHPSALFQCGCNAGVRANKASLGVALTELDVSREDYDNVVKRLGESK